MKCIQWYRQHAKGRCGIDRVSDEEAREVVEAGRAVYVPKSQWKKHVRDFADAVIE